MRPKEELEEIIRQGDEEIKNGSFTVMAIDDIWKLCFPQKRRKTLNTGNNREM